MSATEEPQVAWTAIERGAAVISSDGDECGSVIEVAGDYEADIFNGLVVSGGVLTRDRYLPAERVRGIWPTRVEVEVTAAELDALPEYTETVMEQWRPDGGIVGFIRRLLGRR